MITYSLFSFIILSVILVLILIESRLPVGQNQAKIWIKS